MIDFFKDKTIKTPADYAKTLSEVRLVRDRLIPINIAFLSSYTSEVLNPYISVELAKEGYFPNNYFAPFNQFEQEILNKDGGLYSPLPDVVIIHNMIEDIYPDLISNFAKYSKTELDSIAHQIIERHKIILELLRDRTNADILIVNFSIISIDEVDSIYSYIKQQKNQYIQEINKELLLLCNKISSCYSIDYMNMVCKVGAQEWVDRKLYFMARIPFSGRGQIEFGKILAETICSVKNQPHKCLVLDLDNTLWGGVIGEEGMSGIQISEYYPGNVFKHFQRTILGLRNQGVLLAISSKNNPKIRIVTTTGNTIHIQFIKRKSQYKFISAIRRQFSPIIRITNHHAHLNIAFCSIKTIEGGCANHLCVMVNPPNILLFLFIK